MAGRTHTVYLDQTTATLADVLMERATARDSFSSIVQQALMMLATREFGDVEAVSEAIANYRPPPAKDWQTLQAEGRKRIARMYGWDDD